MFLRAVMFLLVGAMTMEWNRWVGADASVLPWTFVLGGLGAVAAVDVACRWFRRPPP
ncbi:MAG: hypothetical protein J0I77_02145 [Rudaea sp.]|uniref:hypothetical protein n=1 Tax=unclassified Rudaea TaxID=2627037 RepID=UPI0014852668|nr:MULTISPECIES: hypothetical protein [unclassified Rudaea]MBN8884497.1 hypothetical protein [Rudaea sp.]